MKIIALANQKGGVGKTTILVLLATFLQRAKKKIAVIDLDGQANASDSIMYYSHEILGNSVDILKNFEKLKISDAEKIGLVKASDELFTVEQDDIGKMYPNLKETIDYIAPHYDVCLIDTPPSFGNRFSLALAVSDFVIAPVELNKYSFSGLNKLIININQIKNNINPKLVFLGMLITKADFRVPIQRERYTLLTNEHKDSIIPVKIGLKSAYMEAVESYTPLWLNKKSAAKNASKEFERLVEYILKFLEG